MALTKATYSMIDGAWINVLDYGSEDAAAFTAALTAAAGKTLFLPAQTYTIASALTVPANTTIIGYGATLDFSTAGNITALTLGANVTLLGFKMIGPEANAYAVNSFAIRSFGTDNSPSAPTYITGPKIQDVTITNFRYGGISLQYVNNGEISNCKITYCGYVGIELLSCNRTRMVNNYVGQITPGTNNNAYGIAVSSDEDPVVEDPVPYDNAIIGNFVEDVTVWTGIDTHGGDTLIIANNSVINCSRGIKITDREVSGVRTVAPKNCVVSGNFIDDNGLATAAAITVNGAFTTTTQDYARNISVVGNTIQGHGASNNVDEGAIHCYSTKNLVISGNTIRQPKVTGIALLFDNPSFTVSGNVIVDPHDASNNSSCVYTQGTNNLGSIVGNTFTLENAGLATKVAEWAVQKGAGSGGTGVPTSAVVQDNMLVNVTSGRLAMSNFGKTYSGGDTTPDVANTSFMTVVNGGATTITNFDNATEGQVLTLKFSDSNTTIDRANCYLSGGTNFTSTDADTLTLVYTSGKWYEIGRGINA